MKAEHKEFIEAARNLMDTFFVCFGDPGRGEVKSRSYTIPMALLEISKALNRIADEMCRQWAYNKTALDNDKPGDVKVYAEALVLLRQALSVLPPNWAYNKTGRVDINNPFKEISDKHIPVVKTKTEIDEMKAKPNYLNIADA